MNPVDALGFDLIEVKIRENSRKMQKIEDIKIVENSPGQSDTLKIPTKISVEKMVVFKGSCAETY